MNVFLPRIERFRPSELTCECTSLAYSMNVFLPRPRTEQYLKECDRFGRLCLPIENRNPRLRSPLSNNDVKTPTRALYHRGRSHFRHESSTASRIYFFRIHRWASNNCRLCHALHRLRAGLLAVFPSLLTAKTMSADV